MNPKHPIYVVSKGRWENQKTVKSLTHINVPFTVVVEPQEADKYAAVIGKDKLLVLDQNDGGPHYARNFAWEHAIDLGATWFWNVDDNINGFHRLNENMKSPVSSGTIFKLAEDFCERFENVAQGGLQYYMFIPRKLANKFPPLYLNTRIYSCTLNRCDLPFRYRIRYNEDTDLSLQVLKAGWCTVLFNSFLADKVATMTMKGGNTEDYVEKSEALVRRGRLEMARALVELHPDVTKIIHRWGRFQHSVDYRPFKGNKLIPKPGVYDSIPPGFDEHGLVLDHRVDMDHWERGIEPPTRGVV